MPRSVLTGRNGPNCTNTTPPQKTVGGNIDLHGTSFESISKLKPIDQWAAIPDEGKAQIIVAMLLVEFHSEFGGPFKKHYTKGGALPGNAVYDGILGEQWPSFSFANWSGQQREGAEGRRVQNAELNNGRLAMIAIMSYSAAALIPNSVPLLPTPY